jgi:hypothetical protein
MAQTTRWPFEELVPKSAEQSNLLRSHGGPIVEILGEETCNVVHGAAARLQALGLNQADRHNTRSTKTKSLKKTLDSAAEYLIPRRKMIEAEYSDDDVRAAFGLNVKIGQRSPQVLATAYDLFIKAGEKHPELLKKAGVPEKSLAFMKETLQALQSGDLSQEGAKTEAKVSTAERRAAHIEVEAAMLKVVNAAAIAYEGQPDMVALFKATLPKKRSSTRKDEGEESDTPSSEADTE